MKMVFSKPEVKADPQPFKRDWLKEAFDIVAGGSATIKKEHLNAAIAALTEMGKRNEKLCKIMDGVYKEVRAKRIAEGKPVPPPPPDLFQHKRFS